jgi:hypothetical protein
MKAEGGEEFLVFNQEKMLGRWCSESKVLEIR